ncbi:MAG: PTS glucose transporter subunit IIA [Marinisporobacter sp.]|nr:PTS glucose transporter subunit IIA [Marinisporobacter sp.]
MFGFMKNKKVKIIRPVKGNIVEISEVPDMAFSQKMLGDGFAIIPTEGMIKAPVSGQIVQIFPTNHAFGIRTEEGLEILIHIGIDTVELNGEGFERQLEPEQYVKVGDPIIKVDLEYIKSKGKNIITPIVFTSTDRVKEFTISQDGENEEIAIVRLT